MAEDTSGTTQDEAVSANFQVLRSIRVKVAQDQAAGIDRSETRCSLYQIIETVLTQDGPVPGRWDTWATSYVQRCRENGWDDDTIRLLSDEDMRDTAEEEGVDEDPAVTAAGRALVRAAVERALARG
jgi:hypothetical protein